MPIGYPMPNNSENIHAIHTVHNQYGVIRITYVNTYTYMHATTIDTKETMRSKENKKRNMGGFGTRKLMGNVMWSYNFISNDKWRNLKQ